MNKTLQVVAILSLTMLVMGSSADQSKGVSSSRDTRFVDPHELRGIKMVHLEVDGFPTPLEGSHISEVSLARQLRGQLLEAGLKSSTEYVADAPTLHVRVLPVLGSTQGFFVITAEVEENCRVSRSGGVEVSSCTTWSIYPRLGFFTPGDATVLEAQVSDVANQFIAAWSTDNPSSKK